jgi:hydroxylamine reductase (hybrid-cluster protein)
MRSSRRTSTRRGALAVDIRRTKFTTSLSENVAGVLVEKSGIAGIGTVDDDLALLVREK